MSYAGARKIIDADSHVIELDDFLDLAVNEDDRTTHPGCERASACVLKVRVSND